MPSDFLQRVLPTQAIGREQGMPSGQVHRIDQAPDGRLLFAGPAGLVAYDGADLRVYGRVHGLLSHGLRTVAAAADGSIWLGSDAGLDRLSPDGAARRFGAEETGTTTLVERVVPREHDVLLGTGEGIVRLSMGAKRRWTFASWRVGWVRDACAAPDGDTTWFLVAGLGLARWAEGQLDWLPIELPASIGPLLCLTPMPGGDLLVGGQHGAVWVHGEGERAEEIGSLSGNTIQAMAWIDGEIWAGGSSGLRVLARDEGRDDWRVSATLLGGSVINHLFADREGNVWIATDADGVFKVSCLRDAVRIADQSRIGSVLSIRPEADADQGVRVGAANGVFRVWRDSHGHRLADLGVPGTTAVWDSLRTDSGSLLLATQAGVLRIDDDAVPRRVGWNNPVLESAARCLLGQGGRTYCGTVSGLAVLNGDDGELVSLDGESPGYVYHLQPRQAGDAWVCTLGNGLLRLRDGELERVPDPLIEPQSNVYCCLDDDAGRTAMLVDDRLLIRDAANGSLRQLAQGRTAVYGWGLAWQGERLWVGTSEGLQEVDPRSGEVLRCLRPFSTLSGWEFTTPRSLRIGGDGELQCGLSAGLVTIRPDRLESHTEAPSLHLTVVRSEPTMHTRGDHGITIPSGRWRLILRFAPLSYTDESGIRYRYRLQGFNQEWSRPSTVPAAEFTSLPVGDYVLEIEASASFSARTVRRQLVRIQVLDEAVRPRRRA